MSSTNRIHSHPVLGSLHQRKTIPFYFDDKKMEAYEGEPIAAALLANGIRTLRHHEEHGYPRGIYCNIGHCYECRVEVNGEEGVRSCLTLVKEGMSVHSGAVLPNPLQKGGHNE